MLFYRALFRRESTKSTSNSVKSIAVSIVAALLVLTSVFSAAAEELSSGNGSPDMLSSGDAAADLLSSGNPSVGNSSNESAVDISAEATQTSVSAVESLAASLANENSNIGRRTGRFTWDTEGKDRSWTYYNGIMMDAFLMSDSGVYTSYIDNFYNANISAAGKVDNTGASDNYYRENELDSIPPSRALFDLIRGGSAQSAKYKKMIDYVYSVMQNFTVVSGSGGNFIHKMNNSNWNTYQIALDGLYMGQPFFMEIANALDDGILSSSDFQTYSKVTLNADTLYSAVCSRMKWIGSYLYDSNKGLYNHGWGPRAGVNGQFWLRAIGWYAAALADVIDMLPERYASDRAELIAIAQQLFDGMMDYQDEETGLWYNVVDYDSSLTSGSGNLLETSGSALMAYSMMKLYDKGYVGNTYGEAGLLAFNGIVSNFVDSQGLHNVYISSGVETTPAGYLSKSYKTNEAKGVGPLIMASCYANSVAEKLEISHTVTFKVVNGSWDDDTTQDIQVIINGIAGHELKLSEDQIPAVGSKPGEGFKEGSWDVEPDTETAITEDTTYTYTYARDEESDDPFYYYEKVTRTEDITNGEYLIVYENMGVALNGNLETPDVTNNTIEVEFYGDRIKSTAETDNAIFIIVVNPEDHIGTLQSHFGYYIGLNTNANTIDKSDDPDTYRNSFSIDYIENAEIKSLLEGSSRYLLYNDNTDQRRFRYYKDTSSMKPIQLYKRVQDIPSLVYVYDTGSDERLVSDESRYARMTYSDYSYTITFQDVEPGSYSFHFVEEKEGKKEAWKTYDTSVTFGQEFDVYPEYYGDGIHEISFSLTETSDVTITVDLEDEKAKVTVPSQPSQEYSYSVSGENGNTIIATRGDGSAPLALTISAPEELTYDGTAKEATLNDYDKTAFPGEYSIVYRQGETALESAPVNAGTYTASVTVGEGEGAVTASVEYTIRPREVIVSGITAADKTYDGNTDAAVDCSQAVFENIVDGDTLSVTAEGSFADANAGEEKTVTIMNLSLAGDSAGNYVLAAEGQQTETKAAIIPKSIEGAAVTLSVAELVYNGVEQNVSVTEVSLDGQILTEADYDVSGNTGTDVKTYTVTVTGKGNYKDTATAEWNITRADREAPPAPQQESASINSITLVLTPGYEYSMDGVNWQTDNTFTGLDMDTEYTFFQRIAGDANYNTSPASEGAAIRTNAHVHEWEYLAEGAVLTATCKNTDGGHGDQTSQTLTISQPAHSIYGDGLDPAAAVSGAIEGVETPAVVYSSPDGNPPVKAGTYTAGITLGDATASVSYTVAPKSVAITGLYALDKEYDGNTAAVIAGTPMLEEAESVPAVGQQGGVDLLNTEMPPAAGGSVSGGAVEAGDEVNVDGGAADFDNAAAGNGKQVTFSGFTLSGADAGNYSLASQPAAVTANITPKAVTVKALDQTITEDEEIVQGVDQVNADGLLEGHRLSEIALQAADGQINPVNARILDAADADVTANYIIAYEPGILTIIEKISRTATFKVANGLWDDGTAEDKVVTVSGYDENNLKLPAGDIPAAGNQPAEGYEAGSWDVTPDPDSLIRENTVYTYTYAVKQAEDPDPTITPEPTIDPDPTITPEPTIDPDPTITPEPTVDPDPTITPEDPNALTSDGFISVSGLETGDTVSFYRVLQFNADAAETGGWTAAEGFTALTVDEIQKMLGLGDYAGGQAKADQAGIDETLAARIADLAERASAAYADIPAAEGTARKDNPAAGLYIALVTPGQPKFIYNPVFVAADYAESDGTNSHTIDKEDSYQPASMAKKTEITLTKTASTADQAPDGVSAGDTISFTVTTKIPEFGDNYTDAVFRLTDSLSAGLELQTGTIHVYKDAVGEENLLTGGNTYASGIAYKLTSDTSGNDTYTADFFTEYILGLSAPQAIVVTYDAVVTTQAPTSVNLEKNTVTVEYSNEPTDATGKGSLKDETKHYTFDIDANILGDNSWKTTEVVKVGLDASGKEITKIVDLHEGQSVGALEGAVFKLYAPVIGGKTELKDAAGNTIHAEPYTNSILTAGKSIVSDGTGRLTIRDESLSGIRGLDLGTYYLVEETAPAGYIKYQYAVKIEILAPDDADHWSVKTYTEERNGYTVTWDVKELKKYEVRINGEKTAEYTFKNAAAEDTSLSDGTDTAVKGDTITGKDSEGHIGWDNATAKAGTGKIVNTQGAELPSTGGPGTTMFYLLGMIVTAMAGTGLVMKRQRKNAA